MKKITLLMTFASLLLLPGLFACAQEEPVRVLVFSKTKGFRHGSISNGIKVLNEISQKQKWVFTATEDAGLFTDVILQNYDVTVWLNTTQDVLNDDQQAAFEAFIKAGKGYVGIHAATDTEYEWPFYGKVSGAYFKTHPPTQKGTLIIEDTSHPAMKPFEGKKTYSAVDEWYTFKENPRDNKNIHVLASLDESSIKKSKNKKDWKMGDHPVIWWQEIEGARAFYTVFGHTPDAFDDMDIREHLTEAIKWAAKK